MPHLSRILIYPVKSLEPISVESATITQTGGLTGDRVLAMFDERGKFVNGKKQPHIHLLRSSFDSTTRTLHLRNSNGQTAGSFQIDCERSALHDWLSEFFGLRIELREDRVAGFPDDTDAPGPTIISTATLKEVAEWFPSITLDSMRRRFRANLELEVEHPFWEDRLYGKAGDTCRFQIGDVVFEGANPCQRCVVPPRDPNTGESNPMFAKRFAELREQSLPAWAERSRFNHFYRLAVNTKAPADQVGKTLRVGDELNVL